MVRALAARNLEKMHETEDPEDAACRELEEETRYTLAAAERMRPLGSYYSLPSETNKYTHVFLATPVIQSRPASGDTRSRSTST